MRRKGNFKFMSILEIAPERLARLFHEYHQALDDFHGEPQPNRDTWDDLPAREKDRIIAATRLALCEVASMPSECESRRYFAKPGEAEWGC